MICHREKLFEMKEEKKIRTDYCLRIRCNLHYKNKRKSNREGEWTSEKTKQKSFLVFAFVFGQLLCTLLSSVLLCLIHIWKLCNPFYFFFPSVSLVDSSAQLNGLTFILFFSHSAICFRHILITGKQLWTAYSLCHSINSQLISFRLISFNCFVVFFSSSFLVCFLVRQIKLIRWMKIFAMCT